MKCFVARRAFCSLAILLVLALAPAAQAPQFRSGTDIVTVDVTVLDRGGEPATGLKADDFTLTVDGRPRTIQSVRLVKSAGPVPTPGEPPIAQPEQPAESAPILSPPRRFVLVVDREHIPVGEGQEMLEAAATFVDALPPGDHVALWTTAQTTSSVRFDESRDTLRQRLRLSIGTYRYPSLGQFNVGRDEATRAVDEGITPRIESSEDPTNPVVVISPGALQDIVNRECAYQQRRFATCVSRVQAQVQEVARDARDRTHNLLANLGNLVEAIGALDGPKHVVLVTGGPVFTRDSATTVTALAARAARARVILHALQVRDPGNQARTDQMRASPDVVDQNASAAYLLAGATGGLAITPVSSEVAFLRLTRELAAAYLLVFEVEDTDRDGKVHVIAVKVRDRGWGTSVRARKSFRVEPNARATAAPVPVAPAAVPAAPMSTTAAPAAAVPPAPPEPLGIEPGDMADRLARYAELFERQISAVVAEERFVQIIQPWRGVPPGPEKEPALAWIEAGAKQPRSGPIIARRQLVSDVLLVQLPGRPWQSYRDVATVDGQPVRDRADRVQKLFLSGGADRARGFQDIAVESARWNLGDLRRDLNLPTVTLWLLRRANHPRFTFKRQKDESVDGKGCRVLAFKEKARPTLISTRQSGDIFLYGRVWLDRDDGRVRRTELRFDRPMAGAEVNDRLGARRREAPNTEPDVTKLAVPTDPQESVSFRSSIRVDYGSVEGIDILVPVLMWEWYEGVSVTTGRARGNEFTGAQGLAAYSKFRTFQVSTSEAVK
jgi:VWFA-related protein